MSKRLAYLENLVATDKADSFARYALALEYRGLDRPAEALAAFRALRDRDPDYLATYLICGTTLIELARFDEAREWLEAGIIVAKRQRNMHTVGELESALAGLVKH